MDINRNNYESFFLLYIDGELNTAEKVEVENFLSSHADLQKEFSLLQYTIQRPADTIFEPKELLYRREEKRRVVPVYWSRIAAALLLILAGGWFLLTVLNNHKQANSVNKQTVAAAGEGKIHPLADSPEKENQVKQAPDADPSKRTITRVDRKTSTQATTKKSRHPEQTDNTDLQIANATEDAVVAMQKSNTAPELQTSGSRNNEIAAGQLAGSGKTPSLLIAVTGGNQMADMENEQPTELATDNAISVIALNEKNKGITGFFKKITRRIPGNETAENTKKLRVSVFQFSY